MLCSVCVCIHVCVCTFCHACTFCCVCMFCVCTFCHVCIHSFKWCVHFFYVCAHFVMCVHILLCVCPLSSSLQRGSDAGQQWAPQIPILFLNVVSTNRNQVSWSSSQSQDWSRLYREWMESLIPWTWTWANCRRWWGTENLVCCSPWGREKLNTTWLNNKHNI